MSQSIIAQPTFASALAKFGRIGLLSVAVMSLGACSDLTAKQQRVLTGAVIGTTAGTVTTAITGGCIACGAAIGGAVGAGSGYLYDYVQNSNF